MLNKNINVSSISKIIVEGLFGKFNYILPNDEKKDSDFSKIFILYGLNGSGKTTILQLLFHLLSPRGTRKHRTYLRDIKFKKFIVKFTDSKEISAEREENIIGPFVMYIKKNGIIISQYHFTTFKAGDLEGEKLYLDFIKHLEKINIRSYFLTDERDFLSDFISEKYELNRHFRSRIVQSIEGNYIVPERFESKQISRKEMLVILLKNAINRVEAWIRHKVTVDSRLGDVFINKLYLDIISKLSISKEEQDIKMEEWDKLIKDLNDLEKIIPKFSSFKFLSPINIKELKSKINQVNIEKRRSIYIMLKPYIDGLKVKIEALTKIYNLIEKFVQNLNNFFHYKNLEFDFLEGIKIKSNSSDLEIEFLSSGEKQLLLLFCNLLTARDRPSIFIIDEPEISLNVEWQRDLIRTLLELTEESQIQFIFATHSMELLTQYEENVIDLTHIEENIDV